MLRKITFIALAVALLAFAQPGFAQKTGKLHRIGVLMSGTPASHKFFVNWFREGLSDLGYREGKNYVMLNRWAMGKSKRLPVLMKELVRAKVDVIVINGSRSVRAAEKLRSPVPVVVGLSGRLFTTIPNFSRPNGNITGSTYDPQALDPKRLALLKESLPKARRFAYLFMPHTKNVIKDVEVVEASAEKLRVALQAHRVENLRDIEGAFASMAKQRVDAMIIRRSGLTIAHRMRLAELAIQHKLPTLCDTGQFAEAGCLLTYTPDLRSMMRRAAVFVDKILKGRKPADLPIDVVTRHKMVINLKTAKALGIILPSSILLQATEVIE
ncbi:MAG: ABC transporter substrate-binding protein [Alphaproteobacteria bacterium]|nr:ABC transporter substrate-binding protein [Alphaproteobacteria bacterium]